MALSLARFTIKRTLDDSFMLHIEDDSGTTLELEATYDQLDLITEAIEEALEIEADDQEAADDDVGAAVGWALRYIGIPRPAAGVVEEDALKAVVVADRPATLRRKLGHDFARQFQPSCFEVGTRHPVFAPAFTPMLRRYFFTLRAA